MRSILVMALLGGVIGCGVTLGQSLKTASSPEETALAFYKWYIHQVNNGHPPVLQSQEDMKKYVASPLLKELETKKHAGFEADYFLRAQDTLDDWETNVTALPQTATQSEAVMIVTLGATKETKHRLSVGLVREDGLWKIARVNTAPKSD
jgi:hypothetical protein